MQDEHRGYHGEVFVFDTDKACCDIGQAIVDGEAAIRKTKGD